MKKILIRCSCLILVSSLLFGFGCKEERRKKNNRGDKATASSSESTEKNTVQEPTQRLRGEPLPKKAQEKRFLSLGETLGETLEKDGMKFEFLWAEKGIKKEYYPDREIEAHRLVIQFQNLTDERKKECIFDATLLDSAGHQFNEVYSYANDGWTGREIFPGVTGVDSIYVKTFGRAVGDLTFVIEVFRCAEFEKNVKVSPGEIRTVDTFKLLPEFLDNGGSPPPGDGISN